MTGNTNLFGVPPSVAALLMNAPLAAVTRYPAPCVDALRAKLARLTHADGIENVITGCGSDDVLDATFRAFGEPGDRVAFCPPTLRALTETAS